MNFNNRYDREGGRNTVGDGAARGSSDSLRGRSGRTVGYASPDFVAKGGADSVLRTGSAAKHNTGSEDNSQEHNTAKGISLSGGITASASRVGATASRVGATVPLTGATVLRTGATVLRTGATASRTGASANGRTAPRGAKSAPRNTDQRNTAQRKSAQTCGGSGSPENQNKPVVSPAGFVFLIIVLIAVIAAAAILALKSDKGIGTAEAEATNQQEQTTEHVTEPPKTEEVWKPSYTFYAGMYSRQAVLYDYTDNKLLAEIGADEVIYPASLTKMMTVLVAIENISDLSLETSLSTETVAYLIEQNASVAGFSENEKINARDLLYASMLPSGADGSIGLAQIVSGSESAYADLMNKKAAELGMDHTHYMNATGLHDANHYTTASDQLKLMKYAMKNEDFKKVITAQTYTSTSTLQHPQGITMTSTLFKSIQANALDNKYIIGGKTGYTPEAGLCLASIAEIKGHTYFLITFGAGAGDSTPGYHTMDAVAIYDDYVASSSAVSADTVKVSAGTYGSVSDKAA